MESGRSGVYHGWFVVGIALLAMMITVGTTSQAFGIFIIPVSSEMGLSRATMNTGMIILSVSGAIMSPFLGRLVDRYPARLIMGISAVLFGGSFVLLGLSQSVLLDAVIIALPMTIGACGAGVLMCFTLVVRWFTAMRGRAMAIATMGTSLGGIVIVPPLGMLIAAAGWRTALIIEGVIVGALLLLLALVLRERPSERDIEPVGRAAASRNAPSSLASMPRMTTMEILSTPLFWVVGLAVAPALGVLQALVVTVVPLAMERGVSLVEATSLISALSAASIAGKFGVAFLADKVEKTVLIAGAMGVVTLLTLGLMLAGSYGALLISCLVCGLAMGMIFPVSSALLADLFGPASFGTVQGLMITLTAIMGAVCVRYVGEVFDRTGNYSIAFLTFLASLIVSIVLILFSRIGARRRAVSVAGVARR